MVHAVRLSEALQLVDNGTAVQAETLASRNISKGRDDSDRHLETNHEKKGKREENKFPVCLYESHRSKGFRHYVKDCATCPEDEKKKIFKRLMEERDAMLWTLNLNSIEN